MGFLTTSEQFTFFLITTIALILITIIVLSFGIKSSFNDVSPPHLFELALSTNHDIEGSDLITLLSDCHKTFDYIKKYVDKIPLDQSIQVIRYIIKISGFVGQETDEILNQLKDKKTRSMVLYACDKLKPKVCKYQY